MDRRSTINKIISGRVLFVIAVMALAGLTTTAIWRIIQGSKDSQASLSSSINNEPVSIPDNWDWFVSKDGKTKFAYPKTWGQLTESETPEPPHSPNSVMSPVAITKKNDFMIRIGKGYYDPTTWYGWDSDANTMYTAVDKSPLLDGKSISASYAKPKGLGSKTTLEPLPIYAPRGRAIYEVLGQGAMGCGTHHYFFDIEDSVIHLRTAFCSEGMGTTDPAFTREEVITKPLQEIYKYIPE